MAGDNCHCLGAESLAVSHLSETPSLLHPVLECTVPFKKHLTVPAEYYDLAFLTGTAFSMKYNDDVNRFDETMKRSLQCSGPVVTLLSSGVTASRRSQELLCSLFGFEPISVDIDSEDQLSQWSPTVPFRKQGWDSLTSRCPTSGTLLHLLSPGTSNLLSPFLKREDRYALLSITAERGNGVSGSVCHARSLLASRMEQQKWKIGLSQAVGRSLNANQVLGTKGGLPALYLPTEEDNDTIPPVASSSIGLKEVAIPFYVDSSYPNGMTLQSTLSESILSRPGVGLYQWPSSSLVIRPLPAAFEDRNLAPQSLIFKCESLDKAIEDMEKHGAVGAKIGYSGTGKGQLVVRHPDLLPGMEVRFCENTSHSSVFAEAQESLLAGSLGGLQNRNVLLEGGTKGVDDHRIGVGDCWIEFRATLMNPSGFWRRYAKSRVNKCQIAKAPDLPYE